MTRPTYSYTLCGGVGVPGAEDEFITLLLFDVVLCVMEVLEP